MVPDPAPPFPQTPPPAISAHSGQHIRLPGRYRDFVPRGESLDLPEVPPHSPSPTSLRPQFQTEPDTFGLFCLYPEKPTHIPDSNLLAVVEAPTLLRVTAQSTSLPNILPPSDITRENLFSAFSSPTAGLLMCWQYSKSSSKSKDELNRLWTYLKDPQFNPAEKLDFSHDREYRLISKYLQDESNPFRAQHGWTRGSITIPLIKEGTQYLSENDPALPTVTIDNIFHRPLVDVIKSVFTDNVFSTFHLTPFDQYWTTSDGRQIRIYSEAYTSLQMVSAHKEVNRLPRAADDDYERVIIPLMVWSDATQLANFGDASLWPVYLYFGNQSKYIRGKPTSRACHHVAYIPSVSCSYPGPVINIGLLSTITLVT